MASIKISELNEYTEVQDDDLFVVVDVNNEETKKVKATNIGTGGKELIMVGDESVATKNTKLLIETDTLETLGTEVVDTLDGNETTKAPSVRAVKEALSYSTEEQVIGKWIDGKPLYRKVISHTITGSSQEKEPHNISNIDRVISIKNSLINQYGYFMANEPTISANMDAFNIYITSEWATGFTYFIIEYTKTTD